MTFSCPPPFYSRAHSNPSQARKGLAIPGQQGKSWGCVEAERE